MQEMGRCGRNRHSDGSNPTDDFVLIIKLNDHVHMNERIVAEDESSDKESANTIKSCEAVTSKREQMKIQRQELLNVLQLFMLNKD